MLFWKNKKNDQATEQDLKAIAASVRLSRARLAHRNMPIEELFALVGEDERPILSAMPPSYYATTRVLPGDIPSREPSKLPVPHTFPSAPQHWERDRSQG